MERDETATRFVFFLTFMRETYKKIYECVKLIPRGKVSTYKIIAEKAGFHRQPRLTGYALNKLPENSDVPWHRVINSKGEISFSVGRNGHDNLQISLLRSENVEVSDQGKIDLNKYGWF